MLASRTPSPEGAGPGPQRSTKRSGRLSAPPSHLRGEHMSTGLPKRVLAGPKRYPKGAEPDAERLEAPRPGLQFLNRVRRWESYGGLSGVWWDFLMVYRESVLPFLSCRMALFIFSAAAGKATSKDPGGWRGRYRSCPCLRLALSTGLAVMASVPSAHPGLSLPQLFSHFLLPP